MHLTNNDSENLGSIWLLPGSKYSVGSLTSDCVKAFQKCKNRIRKFGINRLGVFYKSTINVIFGTAFKPVISYPNSN